MTNNFLYFDTKNGREHKKQHHMSHLYINVLSNVYLAQIANNSEPVSLVDHLLGSYVEQ